MRLSLLYNVHPPRVLKTPPLGSTWVVDSVDSVGSVGSSQTQIHTGAQCSILGSEHTSAGFWAVHCSEGDLGSVLGSVLRGESGQSSSSSPGWTLHGRSDTFACLQNPHLATLADWYMDPRACCARIGQNTALHCTCTQIPLLAELHSSHTG